MDISRERSEAGEYQQAHSSVVLETIRSLVKKVVELFTITKEDCENAGVYFIEEHRE